MVLLLTIPFLAAIASAQPSELTPRRLPDISPFYYTAARFHLNLTASTDNFPSCFPKYAPAPIREPTGKLFRRESELPMPGFDDPNDPNAFKFDAADACKDLRKFRLDTNKYLRAQIGEGGWTFQSRGAVWGWIIGNCEYFGDAQLMHHIETCVKEECSDEEDQKVVKEETVKQIELAKKQCPDLLVEFNKAWIAGYSLPIPGNGTVTVSEKEMPKPLKRTYDKFAVGDKFEGAAAGSMLGSGTMAVGLGLSAIAVIFASL